jgi:hypothetical protein
MPIWIVIGGVPVQTWIRWYEAPAGARKLPFPNALKSNVFVEHHTRSRYPIGEVGHPRIWDRGENRGYRGLHWIGRARWFVTGELPGYVLTDPTPPLPSICCTQPARASGGLVLGGAAVANTFPPAKGKGGLVLGGAAVANTFPPAKGKGGLVLGGAAVASMQTGPPPSAYYSLSGSLHIGETFGCGICPNGAATSYTFNLGTVTNAACGDCSNIGGRHELTYAGGCLWFDSVFSTVCGLSGRFELTIDFRGPQLNFTQPLGFTWQGPPGWDCISPVVLNLLITNTNCHVPSSILLQPG